MANGLVLRCNVRGVRYDLDTFEDISFRLDISAIQNNQIGSNFGIASQNVALPGSKNNNQFFVAAFNVNSQNVRGFKQSIPCQVLQNGAEVFKGNLILNDVVTDTYKDTIYNVTIVNEAVDFTTLVGDQYLGELDFSDLEHLYTPANVTESFADDDSFLNGDVFYPLIDYGLDGTIANAYPLAMGGQFGKVDNPNSPMVIQQFKPAVRVKAVIDKIFESVNYEYSSSFLNSDEFKSIYFLSTNTDKNGILSNSAQGSGFQATALGTETLYGIGDFGTLTFNDEIFDPLNGFNTGTSTFTVVNSGQYAFGATIPFTNPDPTTNAISELVLKLIVNGSLVTQTQYDVGNIGTGTINFSTAGINLSEFDTVRLDFTYEGSNPGGDVDLLLSADRTFQTLYSPINAIGATVDIAQQFDASIKSLDFLKGIIEKFNLILEPKRDERNVLIVEPFDIWADGGQVKDWSDKYDRAEKVSIKHPIQSQPLELEFADSFDNDVLTDYSKTNFDAERPYGTYTYTSNSDIPKGKKKIGGFFSPIPTQGVPGAPNIITPLMYKKDGQDNKAYKFKPRLGYRIDNQGAVGAANSQFYLRDTSAPSDVIISQYSTMAAIQSYPVGDGKSIHFDGTWYPFHQPQVDGYTPFGTFTEYWGRYINELYDDDARILTLNMNFKPTDLIDIQLNDKIFIDNTYYRINKISGFNITKDDTVKVELLKTPIRQFKFPRRRIYVNQYDDGRDVGVLDPGDYLAQGDVYVSDLTTGGQVTSSAVLKNFAAVTGLKYISGSVYWKDNFNSNNINSNSEQAVRGSIEVDPSVGAVFGAVDGGSIGQSADKLVLVGTNIEIQSNVLNSYIGGENNTIGSGSDNVSIFSSVRTDVGPGTADVTVLSSVSASINGTANTMIGTLTSSIVNGAQQSTLIGTNGIDLDNTNHRFVRHTHIGGSNFEYYNTGSSKDYSNSVGIGQLPDIPTNEGVPTSGMVLMGNSILTGAQYFKVTEVSASAGGTYDMTSDRDSFLTYFNWSGGNGTFNIDLPTVVTNKGRFLRFMTDGTFTTGNTNINLRASGSQTIDGTAEYSVSKDYNGFGILSTGNEWIVIQLKA